MGSRIVGSNRMKSLCCIPFFYLQKEKIRKKRGGSIVKIRISL